MLGNGGGRVDEQPTILPTALEQEYWSLGTLSFDAKDYETAAMHFRKLGARSRPLYNVAVCYLLLNDDDSAVLMARTRCLIA